MIQDTILKQLELQGIPQEEMAKKVNADPGQFSRFLSHKSGLSFESVLSTVKFLLPEEEKSIIGEYLLETKCKRTQRVGLEYCSLFRLFNVMEPLIAINLASGNKDNIDWAKTYELMMWRQQDKYPGIQMLEVVRVATAKTPTMKLLLKVLEVYCYYDLEEFWIMYRIGSSLNKEITECADPFLRRSLALRVSELFSAFFLIRVGDNERARYYANIVIREALSTRMLAVAHHSLSISYYLEDYDKCLYHGYKAMEYYLDCNCFADAEKIEHSYLVNVRILWDNWMDVDVESTHMPIRTVLVALHGDKKKALEMLDAYDFETETASRTSIYARGLILESQELMMEVLSIYLGKSDFCWAKMCRKKLIEYGVNPNLLNAMFKTEFNTRENKFR